AALGFVIGGGVPFTLEASVRSDRDYGVTVGDSAVGEKPLATRGTICANGAQEVNEVKPGDVLQEKHYACKKAEPRSQPFLRTPTECSSSAPVWTLAANPWVEPSNHVSTRAESPMLCESLPFSPEIDFKPSPASEGGTTQADEPTGMALDLKNEQTNEAQK